MRRARAPAATAIAASATSTERSAPVKGRPLVEDGEGGTAWGAVVEGGGAVVAGTVVVVSAVKVKLNDALSPLVSPIATIE